MRWTTQKGSKVNKTTVKCLTCSTEFEVYNASIRRGGGKYCSLPCRSKNALYRAELSRTTIGTKDMSGAKNPRWNGGTSDFRNNFQATKAYKEWRKAVYDRDGYKCVECDVAGNGKNLNADHIKPFSTYPELRLDISNGRTLCIPCHRLTPTYGWRQFNANR